MSTSICPSPKWSRQIEASVNSLPRGRTPIRHVETLNQRKDTRMRVRCSSLAVIVLLTACAEVTVADNGFFGARTNGFVWTASTIQVQRSGGVLTVEAIEDETSTGITLTLPESLGLHSIEPSSPLFLAYFVPGASWSASESKGGTISVNVTEMTAGGIVGTFTGIVHADGNEVRQTFTISQGAFDIRF